ncbi:MORN repeat-containing protein [Actinidia chinensis var. chinensis]|uniref:MORN repeat-containing protein n=1 Tax=Actinidia chinensis var. chinensis TaxID=1590841 RepID=A0A2R6R841_ACTCC|nr:MORN repeat-containing protein [Actinidia chinensis var. chinensis]
MASYISELDFPNFVQYYLTLYSRDYDMAGTYGEPLPFSQEEFGFLNEHAPTKMEAYEWNPLPCDGTRNWLGEYESYFDGYWEEDQFPHGFGVDTFNALYGGGWEKADEAYLGEEHHGGCGGWEKAEEAYFGEEHRSGYDSYNASDLSTWSRDEFGSDEDFLDDNTDGVDTSYSFNWDEMKLCESIFGGWPCLLKHSQESNVGGLT